MSIDMQMPQFETVRHTDLIRLCCWPVNVFLIPRLLYRTGFKPDRDLLRRDCPSRLVRVDRAGGDDQSVVAFRSREFPGFGFGFKRLC